ncbi:MAG: hypothetical protein ACR2MS_01360 [Weeksellaceae bacterium]
MKYIVLLAATISVTLLLIGLYFNYTEDPLKDKFFGFGTIGVFLVTFPLFLIWRSSKFDLKKYVWRNEDADDVKRKRD